MKKLILIPLLFMATACSSMHKIVNDESRQSAAMTKVTLADKHKDEVIKKQYGEMANLTQQVKILLSLPMTAKTIPVANQLLDANLKLEGNPSEHESVLQQEVQDLLASNEKNEETISKISTTVKELQSQKEDADKKISEAQAQVAKTSLSLYQDALKISADDDSKAMIFHIMIGTVIFVVLMILLRIFFTMTKTGAMLAAKLP